MLARLSISLPFNIAVSKTALFPIYGYESDGYTVRVFPPQYAEERAATDPDEVKINGETAVLASMLRIDFQKDTFNRTQGAELDPPASVITGAISSFVNRLRHVARGFNVRPPTFPRCPWRLEYVNDDGSAPEPAEGLATVRGGAGFLSFSFVALTPEIWADVHELTPAYQPPPWDALLLDAQGELPKIGTAIVLAATALEVFIARILDQLAVDHILPKELCAWINDRSDYRQEPTLVEQYDTLLKFFTAHSLKEESVLWESFQHLKQARNTFVHEGIARIGNTNVDAPRTAELIAAAGRIVAKIREWIPEAAQWPAYEHNVSLEFTKALGPTEVGKEQQVKDVPPNAGQC
jgi:hypothetical protein